MAQDSSNAGSSLIVAAVIVALSIVTGSFMLKTSNDRSSESLTAVLGEMQALSAKIAAASAAPSRPAPSARAGRPDPARVYEVDLGDAPTKGPRTAKVKIVEWSDFQCPFCGRANPTLEQVQKEYGDQVQLAFKHLPLSMHTKAPGAHAAAEAANRQGKSWEMHDLLFQNQRALSEEKYLEWAGQLELDIEKFKKDMASTEVKQRIEADKREASKLGVTGTPGFFINGRFLSGAKPYDSFKVMIDKELGKS